MGEADKIIKGLRDSGKKVEEFYMSNKTSDKNVALIEELIQEYKTYNDLDGIQDLSMYINAMRHILLEREQKDKQIKELEEALLKVKDKNTTLFITCRNSIPMQVVIDKMEELNKEIKSCDEIDAIFKIKQQQILQELLEGGK